MHKKILFSLVGAPADGRGPSGSYVLYLTLQAIRGFGLGLIVIAPIYRIESAGFGPLELVLAGTALEFSYFLAELPTGVFADTYGRRRSVVIGAFVMGGAWMLEGAIPDFWWIMCAQAFLGIGWSFLSGAAEAWVVGELGDGHAAHTLVRGQQVHLVAITVGGFVGAGLGTIALNLPIFAAGGSHLLLGIYLLAVMRDDRFVRVSWSAQSAAVSSTLSDAVRAVRKNRVVVSILGAVVLAGMASEGLDRLWEAHVWQNLALPPLAGLPRLFWLPVIGGAAALLSLPALGLARRWVEHESDRRLAVMTMLLVGVSAAGTAVFGFAPSVMLALVAYCYVRVAWNVADPIYDVWIIRSCHPSVRATVLSVVDQGMSAGAIVAGPPIGIIGRVMSIPAALVATGALRAVALPLLARSARKASTRKPDEPLAEPDLIEQLAKGPIPPVREAS